MISREIEVNLFIEICFKIKTKFGDDPVSFDEI